MANVFIRLGLLIAALAVLGLIFVNTEMASGHEDLPRAMLFIGGVIFGGGVVLSAVSKATNVRLWGSRCPKCGHAVPRGHVYCADHFQQAIDQAREHLRHR
jgi:hypothetical protein